MEVLLVRHTSVAVPRGVCYGWSDVPLADSFEQEAAVTKSAIERAGPIDAAFTSPLTRARTLATFCGFPHAVIDARLKEMNMGDWEMQPFDSIKDKELQEWYDDYLHKPTKNGESFPMLFARVAGFLDWLRRQPYGRVAVFAHGGVLVCAGLYAGLFPPDGCFERLVPYGGIETVTLSADDVRAGAQRLHV